ncbi:E3 ubiquitin-protein ligase TRIM68-like isoform X2 [Homarus americanus]|uniref:E3 ubiquitin-protein ligase TRIM68-like isoform X2 n=1 Tax=Homarus americanus TaxID=6706 RepID=UPI001C4568B9|nr:E3 ubiquitin-protein ligase TRIM68-like isoform X2 [Homarus americanus]
MESEADDIRSHPTSRVSPDHSLRGGCHPVKRKKLLSVSHLLIHQHRFQLYCHKLQKANKIVEESRTTSSGPSHTTSSSLPWVIPPPTKYVDPLNCKMCEKRYNTSDRRPRTLRCGHTFCTHCLTPTGEKTSFSCSNCLIMLKIKSVSKIPINYNIEEMVEFCDNLSPCNKVDRTCSIHEKCPILYVCQTHNLLLCCNCKRINHPDWQGCNVVKCSDVSCREAKCPET